jgi:hypothetical protein
VKVKQLPLLREQTIHCFQQISSNVLCAPVHMCCTPSAGEHLQVAPCVHTFSHTPSPHTCVCCMYRAAAPSRWRTSWSLRL